MYWGEELNKYAGVSYYEERRIEFRLADERWLLKQAGTHWNKWKQTGKRMAFHRPITGRGGYTCAFLLFLLCFFFGAWSVWHNPT